MSLARTSIIILVLWVVSSIIIILTPASTILPEATNHAGDIDFLFKFMSVASILVFLIVQGFLLAFVLQFRRKPGDSPDALGSDLEGNSRLEIVWSVVPAVFLVVLTALSLKVYTDIIASHPGAYQINVIARQFSWECDHPAYHPMIQETNGQCHMPVDTQIQLNLSSPDVLHSFWVPEFRVKQDAVPNYPTYMRFETTRVGSYILECAELCGVGHSGMVGTVIVMSKADFTAWAQAQEKASTSAPTLTNVSFGKDIESIFQAHCAACHIANNFGGLHLNSYAGLMAGGNIVPGPIIKPGNHKQSILWEITQPTPPWPGGNRMPLGGPYLKPAEEAQIQAWIDQGAKNN
jgi:cytochrome c oxidase subunit 2